MKQTMDAALDSLPVAGQSGIRQSESARLTALVRAHFPLVWRSLRRLGLSAADADDAAQQVFLIAGRKLERIQSGSERAYLVGVLVRVARDFRRAHRRQRIHAEADPDTELDPRPTPLQALELRQALGLLDRFLKSLEERARVVFVLYEVEELTMQEIADALEIPLGTVASRLKRGRQEFKAALARHQSSEDQGVGS